MNIILEHSAKGTHREKKGHKYIRIENGRYIYPEDVTSYHGKKTIDLSNSRKNNREMFRSASRVRAGNEEILRKAIKNGDKAGARYLKDRIKRDRNIESYYAKKVTEQSIKDQQNIRRKGFNPETEGTNSKAMRDLRRRGYKISRRDINNHGAGRVEKQFMERTKDMPNKSKDAELKYLNKKISQAKRELKVHDTKKKVKNKAKRAQQFIKNFLTRNK